MGKSTYCFHNNISHTAENKVLFVIQRRSLTKWLNSRENTFHFSLCELFQNNINIHFATIFKLTNIFEKQRLIKKALKELSSELGKWGREGGGSKSKNNHFFSSYTGEMKIERMKNLSHFVLCVRAVNELRFREVSCSSKRIIKLLRYNLRSSGKNIFTPFDLWSISVILTELFCK